MSPFGSKLSATVVTSTFEAETRAVVNRNLFREYADDTLLDGVEFDGTTGSSGYTVFARWIAQGLVDKACGLTGGYTRDGPNDLPCINGKPTNDDTEAPFDGAFTCDCAGTTFEGPNCETEIEPSTKSNVGAVAGGLITSFIVILIILQPASTTSPKPDRAASSHGRTHTSSCFSRLFTASSQARRPLTTGCPYCNNDSVAAKTE